MGDDRKINILIQAKDSADAALTSLAARLTSITGIAVAGAAALAAYGLAVAEITRRAIKQEEADVRLAVALASIGANSEEARTKLGALAAEIQDATGISDEAVQEAMGTLIQLGRVGTNEIERVTRATVELAAVTGRDLASAADLMAKAAQGNTAALSRYGIVLDDGIPKSQRLAALLDLIETNMQGTAAAAGQTLGTAFKRVGNDIDDLLQSIGKSIVQSSAFREVLDLLSDALKDGAVWVEQHRDVVDRWAEVLARTVISVAELTVWLGKMAVGFSYASNFIAASLEWVGLMEEGTTELRKTIQMDALSALDAMSARLNLLEEALKKTGTQAKDVPASIKNFGKSAKDAAAELGPLDSALKSIGLETLTELNQKAKDAAEAMIQLQFAAGAGDISMEQFDAMSKAVLEVVNQLREAGAVIPEVFGRIIGHVEKVLSLAQEIEMVIGENMTDAALSFSDTMIDAAFGAKVSWKEFFKQLMADLLKAIARAMILRAIMGLSTAGISSGAGAAGGAAGAGGASIGGGMVSAQHGGLVRGGLAGLDSVAAMLQPGEIVLPVDTARDFREIARLARSQRGSGLAMDRALSMPISITPRGRPGEGEIAELVDAINDLVERKGYRLVASSTVPA